nr:hypothetical protein [Nonomuraea sp. SBT364]
MSDGIVSLGPRCALWPVESHAVLQELVRRIPEPERRALTVVADADHVAAALPTPSAAVPQPAQNEHPSADEPRVSAESPTAHKPPIQDGSRIQDDRPAPNARDLDDQPAPNGDGDGGQPAQAAPSAQLSQGGQVAGDEQTFRDERPMAGASLSADGRSLAGDVPVSAGGRVEPGVAEFGDLLDAYDERRRAELVAAFMVVEHAAEPLQEARFAALRDPALRHTLAAMLARRGRALIQHRERWISGYDDEIAAMERSQATERPRGAASEPGEGEAPEPGHPESAEAGSVPGEPTESGRPAVPGRPAESGRPGESVRRGREDGHRLGESHRGFRESRRGLGESERAVLTLVLVHSVAIPRAEGLLPEDSWLSPHPTPVEELRRHTQLPIGELESALRGLRHAGLLTQVKAGEEAGGYVPGPQFHRLTPAARRRLQEELILAAGPDTPLAAAVRARRSAR